MNPTAIFEIIDKSCRLMDLMLSEEQKQLLVDYVFLFEKWNKTYNLSAIKDVESICKRHVVDGLSVISQIKKHAPNCIADIGTGGGIPGVVLAIAIPELNVFLVESVGKKCRFLTQVTNMLSLKSRVTVINERVESWRPEKKVNLVICRAFSSLKQFVKITKHLDDGELLWFAMKSDEIQIEEDELNGIAKIMHRIPLKVPFEEANRQLLIMDIVRER